MVPTVMILLLQIEIKVLDHSPQAREPKLNRKLRELEMQGCQS